MVIQSIKKTVIGGVIDLSFARKAIILGIVPVKSSQKLIPTLNDMSISSINGNAGDYPNEDEIMRTAGEIYKQTGKVPVLPDGLRGDIQISIPTYRMRYNAVLRNANGVWNVTHLFTELQMAEVCTYDPGGRSGTISKPSSTLFRRYRFIDQVLLQAHTIVEGDEDIVDFGIGQIYDLTFMRTGDWVDITYDKEEFADFTDVIVQYAWQE